jgi:hypothetical protein
MSTNHANIIYRKNQLWLSEAYILANTTGLNAEYMRVAARPRYKQSVRPCEQAQEFLPDTNKAWRWAKVNGVFYYCYDNIPDKAPSMYRSQLPTKHELLELLNDSKKVAQVSSIELYIKGHLNEHYSQYLHCFGDCSKTQQQNLAKACALVDGTVSYIKETSYDLKKNNLFFDLSEVFKKEDYAYIPHNYRCLKNKIKEVMDGTAISEVIWLPRADNKLALKYDDAEVESWVIQLRDMGQNYTNSYIIRKIEEVCNLSEKPVPSTRWIGGIMEKHRTNFLTAQTRFGDKSSHGNMYKGYVPMANALFAGDCWQVDATRFNIIGHKASEDRVGEKKSKTSQYIFFIAVRDVHSGDIIGYDFDYSENRWTYVNALAMAVKETGYLPYELVFDRFPGHNTEEFKNLVSDMEARKVKVTFGHKTTAKQRLERHFGTLQTVFMQDSNYYYGQGIKSRRRYAHRSEQYLTAIRKQAKKDGFDFDAAVQEASTIVEKYRSTALADYSRKYATITKTPKQLHDDCKKPNVTEIDQKQFSYLFGLKKLLPVKHEGLFITEIHKTEFLYRTTDYNIISNYSHVIMCYDLEDLSFCHLYENNNSPLKKYLGIAHEEIRAQGFGPDAQWGKVAKQQAILASLQQARMEDVEYRKAVGDDIVTLLTPGTSSKDEYNNAESTYLNTQVMTVVSNSTGSKSNEDWEAEIRSEY